MSAAPVTLTIKIGLAHCEPVYLFHPIKSSTPVTTFSAYFQSGHRQKCAKRFLDQMIEHLSVFGLKHFSHLTFTLTPEAFSYWNTGSGSWQGMLGSSSHDTRLTGSFQVQSGPTSTPGPSNTLTKTNTPAPPTNTPTASTNLALNKPATSSSNENTSLTPNRAIDGNTGTRWSSAFSDPQWIQVDLGATQWGYSLWEFEVYAT